MPLASDANDQPAQALHPRRTQLVPVSSLASVLSSTFLDDTIALELQPDTDVRLRWGAHADNAPGSTDVFLKAGRYYVYSVMNFTKIGLMAANGAADGMVIITELC